jgi:hypothetical protein
MTIGTEIKSLEQAKRYFISMGCSGFHMMRETPQRFNEYKSLDIDTSIESERIKEEFENKIKNFNTITINEYGHLLRSLGSIIERKEFYLDKLLELVMKMQDKITFDQIGYVLSTIIGNNGTKSKGGLIQKPYDLKRIDLANKFYAQTKLFVQKADENSIALTFVRGSLIDYYCVEESKDFIIDLREKCYSEGFEKFKEGADEGNKYSMKKLSDYYKEGKGCIADIDKAKCWE